MEKALPELEQRRAELYTELAGTEDFRRGSITATFRKCGKPNCACAVADHPGHGPRYLLTWKVAGKTEGRQLRAGAELEKASREVANYRRFSDLSQQIVEVNEAICDAKPVVPLAGESPSAQSEEKGGSSPPSRGSSSPR